MPSKLNLRDRLEDGQLDLSMSEIEDVPVKEIAQIKKATSVDLSNNLLKSLGKNFAPMLTHLIKLDLSKNRLTELPENFGELVNLKHLDLYSNQLTHLPLSMGQLKVLRWLDLKGNPLIPKLQEIAGPCLDTQQCQQCARKVVSFYQTMQIQVAEERQRRLLQKRKQQELAEQAKKEQQQQQQQQSQKNKKKKAAKANANAQTKAENGVNSLQGSGDYVTNAKKNSAKQQTSVNVHNKSKKVSSLLFRFIKFMLLGALFMSFGLWMLYVFDEEKFRGVQTNAVQIWEAAVAVMPIQVLEAGQKLKEITKPVVTVVWSKIEAGYVWVSTDPTCQQFLETSRGALKLLCTRVYEFVRTVNQQIPVYVETVKKKFF
ncbi:hypothetical protein C0J52_00220 [Blattella germanica]|nr:hypothetical protein C0J52_00220 [Blattella germanica]